MPLLSPVTLCLGLFVYFAYFVDHPAFCVFCVSSRPSLFPVFHLFRRLTRCKSATYVWHGCISSPRSARIRPCTHCHHLVTSDSPIVSAVFLYKALCISNLCNSSYCLVTLFPVPFVS